MHAASCRQQNLHSLETVIHRTIVFSLQVRSTVLRFDAFPALRRLILAGGLFKELRLPAQLRQLTLGAGLMYNDISGGDVPAAVQELHPQGLPGSR